MARRSKAKRSYCGKDHKVIFPTELDAKLELVQHFRFDTDRQRVYKCPFGRHYHLTSQEKKK